MLVERRNVGKSWSKNWAFRSRVKLLTPRFSMETPKKLHEPGTKNHSLAKDRQTGYRCNKSTMDVYLRDLLFRLFDDCETNLSRRTLRVDAFQARPVRRLWFEDCHWLRRWPEVARLTWLHSCVSTTAYVAVMDGWENLFVNNINEVWWTSLLANVFQSYRSTSMRGRRFESD